jgi:hypothetical protein
MIKNEKKQKKNFPMLGVSNWYQLRQKCKKSFPETLDPDYLSKTLGMTKRSAANNVIPYLKVIGLFDSEGKPTELATRWLDDSEYAKVCNEIKEAIFPKELATAVDDPQNNKLQVKRWFIENVGAGEGAAARISAFYTMLASPEIKTRKPKKKAAGSARKTAVKKTAVPAGKAKEKTEKPIAKKAAKPVETIRKRKPKAKKAEKPVKAVPKLKVEKEAKKTKAKTPKPGRKQPQALRVYDIPGATYNIQIVLSKETTPEQIDKVFKSIAKHLKSDGEKLK